MQVLHHGFACNTEAGFSLVFAHGNFGDTTSFTTADRNDMVTPASERDASSEEDDCDEVFVVPSLESMIAAESAEEFANLEAEDNPILERCLITPSSTFEEVGGGRS